MRKLISLILAVGMILSLFILPVNAISTNSYNETNDAELLYSFGAIDEELKTILESDTEITRAQFAAIIAQSAKLNGENISVFSDVDNSAAYLEEINAVSAGKIMMGDGNGNFNPSSYVTGLDALICALRVLGYEEMSQFNGGYPTGYYVSAGNTRLLNGVGKAENTYIKGRKLARLIKNMLNEPFYHITKVGDNSFEKELTANSFLYINYHINKIEGVVTGNTGTLLNSAKETGGIIIDGTFLPVDNKGYDIYIGMKCEAYYDIESTELIYMCESETNQVKTITADELVSVNESTITYEVYDGKTDTETFPQDAYILYNGRFLGTYSDTLFDNMKTGEIKLIDNNNDNKIDVVSIFSYETYIIDSVNSYDNIITFKYGTSSLTEDDLKDVVIYKKDGITDISWLHEYDALDVLRDDSGNVIAVYAAGSVERKKAVSYQSGKDGFVTFSDGTSANLHPDALSRISKLELNTFYAFSFDMFGNIVDLIKDDLDKICVIAAVGESAGYEPDLYIKYYTENEELIETKLEGNIKFNDVLRKMDDDTDYSTVKTALFAAKGDLAEIKTSQEGKILAVRIMQKVYDSEGTAVNAYLNKYTNAVIPSSSEQYFVKKGANAFYVPNSLVGTEEKDFAVRKSINCGVKTVAVAVYKKLGSTDIDADAVKFIKNASGMDGMGSYDNPMLVSRKSQVYVEEEDTIYTRLSYWHNGTENTAMVKDDSVIAAIDEGDVAWIDVDEGEIMGVVKYFDYSENKSFPPQTTNPKSYTSSRRMNTGFISKTFDELYEQTINVRITSKDAGGNDVYTDSQVIELHRYPMYGYVFDSTKSQKVRKATPADFIGYAEDNVNYSRIFVHSSYTTDYMAVIYK